MHDTRRTMQHRRRRVQDLEERAPALINLPIPLPSIPLLSPILTHLIAGSEPKTTSSTPPAATTPPAQAPPPPPATPTSSPDPPATTPTSDPNPPSSPNPSSSPSSPNPPSSPSDPQDGSGGNGAGNGSTPANGSSPTPSAADPSSPSESGSPGSPSSPGSPGAAPSNGSTPQDTGDAAQPSGIAITGGGQAFVSTTESGSSPEETDNGSPVGAATGTGTGNTAYPAYTGKATGQTTGVNSGSTSTSSEANPANPSGSVDASSSHHGISTGIIAAIAVISLLFLLLLGLCCVRRRAVAARFRRRKQWFGAAGDDAEYADKDAGAGTKSARSSFATSYDRGQLFSTSDPFAFPAVSAEQMAQIWPSELSGSITVQPAPSSLPAPITVPPVSHTVQSQSSPTIRAAPDRSSIHSTSSGGSSRPSSQASSQYLVAPPPVANGSPPLLSPFSVRPFTPSETWSFPKPPQDDSTEVFSGSIRSSSLGGSAFVTAEGGAEGENENPFADFTEVFPDTASTVSSVDSRFASVEAIRRPFMPSMEDEMEVRPGDEVRILRRFDDGWAVATHLQSGAQGLIPIDCLRAVEEDLPAFLAKKRISSYINTRQSVATRASVLSGGSSIGAAM